MGDIERRSRELAALGGMTAIYGPSLTSTLTFVSSKERFGYFIAPDKATLSGASKSPIGFLGKRKHTEALSFSARKTMSAGCGDEPSERPGDIGC